MAAGLLASAPAFAAGECWIDSATGQQVATTTIPAKLGETAYAKYLQSGDRNHAFQSGQNFVREPDGNWIDSATGKQVPTTTIPARLGESAYAKYLQSADRRHAYQSGQNFVLAPCPPSTSLHAIALPLPPTPPDPLHYRIEFPVPPAPPPPPFYAGVLAGPDLAGTVTFTSPEDLNLGGTFGVFGGMNMPLQGVSVEANVLHTSRTFTKFPNDGISTTSFMLDGKYTVPMTNNVSVYGGFGLGVLGVSEDYTGGGTGAGFGYNFMIGANMQFTPVIAGTVQLRHEGTFGPILASNNFDITVDNTAILFGAQIAFPPPAAPPP